MCPPPLTDGAAAGTWRGETDASGLHGVDVAVGLARMLLQSVPLGQPNTTGWRGPLVKARPCKVKGLDPVVKRYRVSRDGIKYLERDKIMSFLHNVGTCAIGLMVIFHNFL